MPNNLALTTTKYVLIDLIGDILYWPVWWYSKGLIKIGLFCLGLIRGQQQRLGLAIWIKNIFTPMFGQSDLEGRLISFFARLVQIIFRSILLLVWSLIIFLLFLIYLILPMIVVYQLVTNFLWLFR